MSEMFYTRNASTRFAGRGPVGTSHPVTVSKSGQLHVREHGDGSQSQVLACGLACSEIVSGRNLAEVLKPGFEYERQVLEDLAEGRAAAPLSIHTSAGVPAPLAGFLGQLERHLPWRSMRGGTGDDWCVSLQMEGASAVMAGVDLLLQLRHLRAAQDHLSEAHAVRPLSAWKVGVGNASYHGPPSTSPGSALPLFAMKHNQITYPVPSPFMSAPAAVRYLHDFAAWLDENAADLGCLLVEPQWGSSQAAFPWEPLVLRTVVDLARSRGVLVLADEIMCGLGRHGHGSMFLSEAWGLQVDAVTFGKAVAAGAYPLSGVVLRCGAHALGVAGRTVMQSHTYSGGTVRALLAATAVLEALPAMLPAVTSKGKLLEAQMRTFERAGGGLFRVQGQGLMWGALVDHEALKVRGLPDATSFMAVLRENCLTAGVLPYFIPRGGFMVTPLYDVPEDIIGTIGRLLVQALLRSLEQVGLFRVFVHYLGSTVQLSVAASDQVVDVKKRFSHLKVSFCLTCNGSVLREVNDRGECATFADNGICADAKVAVRVC